MRTFTKNNKERLLATPAPYRLSINHKPRTIFLFNTAMNNPYYKTYRHQLTAFLLTWATELK